MYKGEKMKNIKIPVELWKNLKYLTIKYECSLATVIEMLFNYYMENSDNGKVELKKIDKGE
jgi:hypothetical protein